MLIKNASDIKSSEITPESVYINRRKFVQSAMAAGTFLAATACSKQVAVADDSVDSISDAPSFKKSLVRLKQASIQQRNRKNSWQDITTYNNFYEFGLGKSDPSQHVGEFPAQPWTVNVSGEADVTGSFALDDFLKPHTFEERIYRLRCVEAWSMVIPWVGISLADVIKRFQPNSRAKYVQFETLHDPKQMPGQRRKVLDWPYVEGLTIEEAMNPLSILAVGLYDKVLPGQNGAPLRLVVPWKYGFKSIKSIVSIKFTNRMPRSSWAVSAPREYGFYANVNPTVDHPRWSQAAERPIGEGLFAKKKPTLMFNGYADQVAGLYDGLDLAKYF